MPKTRQLRLKVSEKALLERLIKVGVESARVIRRANVLLLIGKGWKRESVVTATGASTATIGRVKRAYLEEGLDRALYEEMRSGRAVIYGAQAKKKIIALACSSPPKGYGRWSLKLLAEYSGLKPRPSRNTVSLILKEDGIRPWREKNVVRSRNRRGVPAGDG